MNLMEDILNTLEKCTNQEFYISLIDFTIPLFSYQLQEKVPHEFKQFLERLKKYPKKTPNI